MIQFFMAMNPPRTTNQQHKVRIVKGHPIFYKPDQLVKAEDDLRAHLAQYRPNSPMTGPLRLVVKWCFPCGKHPDGSYKATRPDTDNLQKSLKDIMTHLGFWMDDSLVCSEIVEKFWTEIPGIFIRVEEIENASKA